jgi:hypothetical protein
VRQLAEFIVLSVPRWMNENCSVGAEKFTDCENKLISIV